MPFSVTKIPVRRPTILPVLPRNSSSASGFFFCGISELPVAYASDSFTYLHKPQVNTA